MATRLKSNSKQWVTFLVLVFSSLLLPSFAKEQAGCFLKDAQGKSHDLGNLCPFSPSNPANKVLPSSSPEIKSSRSSSSVIKVPIKRRQFGVPIIDVVFNGRQHYDMAFDTGASLIAITPQMAEQLGVKTEKRATVYTANGPAIVEVGKIGSARVGNIIHKDLWVLISPQLPIGLLGQNFFGGHDLTIKAHEIVINPLPRK